MTSVVQRRAHQWMPQATISMYKKYMTVAAMH